MNNPPMTWDYVLLVTNPHYRVRQPTLLPCSDMLTLTQQCEARHPEPETVAGASVGVILAQIIFTAEETLEVFTVLLVILISF